tara:strand:+ start:185 stop:457 length:273 start_codon:yes stop_codon:yes gene_type:complete
MGGFTAGVAKAVNMGAVKKVAAPTPAPTTYAKPAATMSSPTQAEVEQTTATQATTGIAMKRKGRTSTILTGSGGLGEDQATTTKKSLLGG